MRKFSVIFSALLISCLMVVTASAAAQIKVDNINVNSDNITLSVVLSELPNDIVDLSAVTIKYEFDKTKMAYTSTDFVALKNAQCSEGNVSWFDATGTNLITSEKINSEKGILFNLNFSKISGATGNTSVKITFVELADSKANVSKVCDIVNGTVNLGTSSGNGNNNSNSGKNDSSSGTSNNNSKDDTNSNGNVSSNDVNNNINTSNVVISDIESDNWAYVSAMSLIQKGIISGDGTDGDVVLRPDDAITREEAAKMALLAMGVKAENGLELKFTDSENISDWAKDYIATAVKYNAISGYDDNTVRSKNTITREEMITMLIKAFNWGTSEDELTFADNNKITWSKPYLAQAIALGVLKGYDDNTIKPDANITRAEAFALIDRCIKLNDVLTKQ